MSYMTDETVDAAEPIPNGEATGTEAQQEGAAAENATSASPEAEKEGFESGPAFWRDGERDVIIAGSYPDASGARKVFVKEIGGEDFIEVDEGALDPASDGFQKEYDNLHNIDLKPGSYKMWTPKGVKEGIEV